MTPMRVGLDSLDLGASRRDGRIMAEGDMGMRPKSLSDPAHPGSYGMPLARLHRTEAVGVRQCQ